MLKRTKYSRLRDDSLTSLEDSSERMLPLRRDLRSDCGFAQRDPPEKSTLRSFIPCLASEQPVQKGRMDTRADWGPGPEGPFCCTRPPHSESSSGGRKLLQTTQLSTKRPITLRRMSSLPCAPSSQRTDGLCCLRAPSALDDLTVVRTASRAVHHHIKYIGSVEVTQSMRTLNSNTRIQVTREAISRLCETSMKTTLKSKMPACKSVSVVLGRSNMQFSGSRAILKVSTDGLTLVTAPDFQIIAHHPIQAISFASGGDPDMANYVAYVAKDFISRRACHIMECPKGRAAEVINCIGQAFETRFRQLLSQTSMLLSPRSMVRICPKWCFKEKPGEQKMRGEGGVGENQDYCNVSPRKTGKDVQPADKDANIQEVCLSPPVSLYENYSIRGGTAAPPADPEISAAAAEGNPPLEEASVHSMIQDEAWFHGRLGRAQAESLLVCSGDFLVRESSSASGQYVLSGMEDATVRHLLLVDPHGQVRTRDQVFRSVGHLVRFHMENQLPISSGSSKLCLKQPILQLQ